MYKKHLSDNRPKINQMIRLIRKQAGYDQAEAAEIMGMKYDTFAKKERNGNISIEWAIEFARKMGVSPTILKSVFDDDTQNELENNTEWKMILDSTNTGLTLTANTPENPLEKLYGKPQKTENKKTITYELNATEQSVIDTFRRLSKDKRQNVFDFMNNIK